MASYGKLGETSSHPISISDTTTANSSVASSNSRTGIIDLNHPNRLLDPNATYTADYSVTPSSAPAPAPASADALANLLLDPLHPTETLTAFPSSAIDISNLTITTAFAQGAFGKIYRGAYNGEEVAIKLLERPDYDPERAQLTEQQFLREVMMLANLNHPNIVRFIGACRKRGVWCIVTEYAKGGSLRASLARRGNRTVGVKGAVRRALDVARGMSFIHAHGLIHRDLKSDNLLMFGDKTVKIADFGVARIEARTEGMTPGTGTYRWMAPFGMDPREVIRDDPAQAHSQKVDVYSFGIVLWELVTGMLPFEDMTPIQTAFAVVNKGTRPVIPQHCLPALSELMKHCWDANPDARPPFKDIVMMLQNLESEIVGSARKAFFRCWTAGPMTED